MMATTEALDAAYAFLKNYIDAFGKNGKNLDRYQKKFERIFGAKNHRSKQWVLVGQAWQVVYKNAKTEDDAISVFLGLPDKADNQPFAGLSRGHRNVDPDCQQQKYQELAKCVDSLSEFLTSENLSHLLADQANEWNEEDRLPNRAAAKKILQHAKDASELWQHHGTNAGVLNRQLSMLRELFLGANPHRWYLSPKHRAPDANKQGYIKLVAQLNRHLKTPQHAALAELANRNIKETKIVITHDAVRKSWANYTRTKSGKFFKS